jgi:N-acetylglutamate synthase-like GNAT family acetyltransferase
MLVLWMGGLKMAANDEKKWNWIVENPPLWNDDKRRILESAPKGAFAVPQLSAGQNVPGEWWRVEDDAGVAGYGWMDCTWGDAEVLLAVDPARQRSGVGEFILDHLEKEAAGRGLHYLHNVVQPSHPERERVAAWLMKHGFARDHDKDLLKRPVRHGKAG